MRLAYSTPKFSDSDPLVCHSLQLRPSLWAVVFGFLGDIGQDWSWRQDDPSNATVGQVTAEVQAATDAAIFAGCIMIGEIKELALAEVPDWLLRCDGAEYLIADYPELASLIHPGYITDETHFRVPDRNRRLGMDGIYPAMQEGSETHTNTLAELVPHDHTYTEIVLSATTVLGELAGFSLSDDTTSNTGSAGSGDEYSILNPVEGSQFYIVARYPSAG